MSKNIFHISKVQNLHITIAPMPIHDGKMLYQTDLVEEENCRPNQIPSLFCEENVSKFVQKYVNEYTTYYEDYKSSLYTDIYYTNASLLLHHIRPIVRSKMLDWMIEVLSLFESKITTYFTAALIMDKFLMHTERCLEDEDVHLIGVTSMFMSSKLCDITPIHMDEAIKFIGRNKFS